MWLHWLYLLSSVSGCCLPLDLVARLWGSRSEAFTYWVIGIFTPHFGLSSKRKLLLSLRDLKKEWRYNKFISIYLNLNFWFSVFPGNISFEVPRDQMNSWKKKNCLKNYLNNSEDVKTLKNYNEPCIENKLSLSKNLKKNSENCNQI